MSNLWAKIVICPLDYGGELNTINVKFEEKWSLIDVSQSALKPIFHRDEHLCCHYQYVGI